MGEVHGHEGVAGLHEGEINGHVGGCAGVGLDVGGFGTVEFADAFDAERLDFIDDFAAAVVPFAGIAFGVFIGENGGHCLADSEGGNVFAGDEFEVFFLPFFFFVDEFGDCGVYLLEAFSVGVHRRRGCHALLLRIFGSRCWGVGGWVDALLGLPGFVFLPNGWLLSEPIVYAGQSNCEGGCAGNTKEGPEMELGKEEQQILEIKELRSQMKAWRWGLFGVSVLVVAASIGTVNTAFRGLTDKGPKQDEFVQTLTAELDRDVKPMVEDMARQTISEVRPEINAAFEDVNNQMPVLAEAALGQLDQLQQSLPERSEKVLREAFVTMLQKKETDLQEMFPEATEEQIERLLTNLASSAGEQAQEAAVELFGKHVDTLMAIHKDLEVISAKEEKNLAGVDPSWEMGLLVMDILREDLERSRPDKGAAVMASKSDSISSMATVAKKDKKSTLVPTTKPLAIVREKMSVKTGGTK